MAIKVFPSANAVGGAAQKVLSEGNMTGWMGATAPRNYVISGLEIQLPHPASQDGAITLTVSSGSAMLAGCYVVVGEPLTVIVPTPQAVTGSVQLMADCHVYLCLSRDAVGNATGARLDYSAVEVQAAPDPPDDDHINLGYVNGGSLTYTAAYVSAPHTPWPTITELMGSGTLFYATYFDSVDGMAATGTATPGEQYVTLTAAASSGASATLRKKLAAGMRMDMRRPYAVRMCFGYSSATAASGYVGVGTPASKAFLGISYRDGIVYGCYGDGATLTETTQIATSGSQLQASTEVAISVSNGRAAWSAPNGVRVQADTGLPTYLGDSALLYAEVKTGAAASKSMALGYYSVAQLG